MYPNAGGYKNGRPMDRLPDNTNWELLKNELERALGPYFCSVGLVFDHLEFAIEAGMPMLNVYFSTMPQGPRDECPELDAQALRDVVSAIMQIENDIFGR